MIAALAALIALQATVPRYWGDLKPGPHPVGFTQFWITDSTRRLPKGQEFGLTHRPVLVNLWYPARATSRGAMRYDDYFQGAIRAARGSGFERYASALIRYQRNTAWRELARVERDSTDPALSARVEALFRTNALARRDEPRARLNSKVIVYTGGSGSSMEDNVVLCEYLASLGYTVVGSAFPSEDNTSFATNVSDRSRPRDIARIMMELPRRGFPVTHVTAIGHSAGAQALQWLSADPSAPVDAVLSLDTTQDYSMLSDRSWVYYTDELIRNRRNVRMPILFVADPEALFELADSLGDSRRTLLTVPGLDHNDFISQGHLSRQLLAGGPDADTARQHTAARNYRALVEYAAAWIAAVQAEAKLPVPPAPLAMTLVPAGEKFPSLPSDTPRSAREVRHLFAVAEAPEFVRRALLARNRDQSIASNGVVMMILVDAIRRGHADRARAAYRELIARDTTTRAIPDRMEQRAKLFESIGASDIGADWRALRQALIEPHRE